MIRSTALKRIKAVLRFDILEIRRSRFPIVLLITGPLLLLGFSLLNSTLLAGAPKVEPSLKVKIAIDSKTMRLTTIGRTLTAEGVEFKISPDPKAEVRNRDVALGITTEVSAEAKQTVTIAVNGVVRESRNAATAFAAILQKAERDDGDVRLKYIDVAEDFVKRSAFFFGFLLLISGQIPIAIGPISTDLLAESKERRTYEVLLASPLTSWELVLSKLIVMTVMGTIVLTLATTTMVITTALFGGPYSLSINQILAFYLWELLSRFP